MTMSGSPPQSDIYIHQSHQAPQNTHANPPPYPGQSQLDLYSGQPMTYCRLWVYPASRGPRLSSKFVTTRGMTVGASSSPEQPLLKEVIVKLVRSFLLRICTCREILSLFTRDPPVPSHSTNDYAILGILGPPVALLTSPCSCFRFVLSNSLVSWFFGRQS